MSVNSHTSTRVHLVVPFDPEGLKLFMRQLPPLDHVEKLDIAINNFLVNQHLLDHWRDEESTRTFSQLQLSDLSSVKSLGRVNYTVPDEELQTIQHLGHHFKTLTVFGCSNKFIGHTNDEPLVQSIQKATSLEMLRISSDHANTELFQNLSNTWGSLQAVTECNLYLNSISNAHIQIFSTHFKQLTSLSKLHLTILNTLTAGIESIFEHLTTFDSLIELQFSGSTLSAKPATALAAGLRTLSSLQVLNLARSPLKDDGAIAFSQNIPASHPLIELNLSNCHINPLGMEHIFEALPSFSALQKLHLNDNKIGQRGALVLAQSLKQFTDLTCLNIEQCELGDLGMKQFSESLETHFALNELNLTSNSLGDRGITFLANNLYKLPSLMTLHASSNVFSSNGTSKIIANLHNHFSLRNIPKLALYKTQQDEINVLLERNSNNIKQKALNLQLRCWIAASPLDKSPLPPFLISQLQQKQTDFKHQFGS